MTPSRNLISSSHSEEWLAPVIANASYYDVYYLKYKYGTLETISEDTEEILNILVEAAISSHAYKWSKLYDTTVLEYNPIWNYDGETTITEVRGERHEEDTIGASKIVSDSRTAPTDSAIVRDVGQTETNADEKTDIHTANEYTDTITETKGGNQGTTTTQKMISEERDISIFNYIDIIYKDIINTISSYSFN